MRFITSASGLAILFLVSALSLAQSCFAHAQHLPNTSGYAFEKDFSGDRWQSPDLNMPSPTFPDEELPNFYESASLPNLKLVREVGVKPFQYIQPIGR